MFRIFGSRPTQVQINAALLLIAQHREKLADAQKKPLKEKELKKDELEKSDTTAAALKAANKALCRTDQNAVAVFTAALKRKEIQPTGGAEVADEPIPIDDAGTDDGVVVDTEADPEDALANALTAPALTDRGFDVVEEPLVFSGTITSEGPAIIGLDKAGLCFQQERKSGPVKDRGVRISVVSPDDGRTIRVYSDKPFGGIIGIKLPVVEKDAPAISLDVSLRLSYKA